MPNTPSDQHLPTRTPGRRTALAAACGLLLAGWLGIARAESPAEEMLFARLGADSGLSQGSVTAIQQDGTGFIWIGTEDGLNRYDGHEFVHIVRDRRDPRSLSSNWISTIARDARGELFIGTDGGSVVMRDAATGRFVPLLDAAGKPLLDPQAMVRTLEFDRNGRLWVGTRGNGVALVDLQRRTRKLFQHDPADPGTLSGNAIVDIVEDVDGRIWIASEGGLDSIEVARGTVTRWSTRLAAALPEGARRQVAAMQIDERGTLWLATGYGLGRFDTVAGTFALLQHAADDARSLPDGARRDGARDVPRHRGPRWRSGGEPHLARGATRRERSPCGGRRRCDDRARGGVGRTQ